VEGLHFAAIFVFGNGAGVVTGGMWLKFASGSFGGFEPHFVLQVAISGGMMRSARYPAIAMMSRVQIRSVTRIAVLRV